MTKDQLLTFLTKKVVLNETLTDEERQELERWMRQSRANRNMVAVFSDRRRINVTFHDRPRIWMIVLVCIIAIVLGTMLGQITERKTTHVPHHPYETNLPDSTWKRIDSFSRSNDMEATYNNLGVLSFRLANDTASMLTPPIIYKANIMDSLGFMIYLDLIGGRGTFLNMVISKISLQHENPIAMLGGSPNYSGIYYYSIMEFEERIRRQMQQSVH